MPDFVSQLQAEIIAKLPTRTVREREAFGLLPIEEQVWRFMNWKSRLVHPHPRKVLKSESFDATLPCDPITRETVDAVLGQIATGANLTQYLSNDVWDGYCPHPRGKKHGRDFDLLLNEWAIHHLHLDDGGGPERSRDRSSELLFVIFVSQAAFVIAIGPHGRFANKDLVSAAVCSWPTSRLFISLNISVLDDWGEAEHITLRKAGIATVTTADNKAWVSRLSLGLTTALVSISATRESDKVLRLAHFADEQPQVVISWLQAAAVREGIDWPVEPSVGLRCINAPDRFCFAFMEDKTGIAVTV